MKSLKTSEISKKMPQRTIQSNNSTSKKLKAIVRQQSQHKTKVEKSLSHKDVWVRLLSNELNPRTHGTPIKFLRELYWQKHCQLRLEGTETVQEEKKPLDPRSSTGRKQAKETGAANTDCLSWKWKDDSGQSQEPQRIIPGQE